MVAGFTPTRAISIYHH